MKLNNTRKFLDKRFRNAFRNVWETLGTYNNAHKEIRS
jgi:hypothetical protein